MPRDYNVYLDDIIEAVRKIRAFTAGMPLDDVPQDAKTFDAVIRNLEVIGEAVKHLPDDMRRREPEVDWRKIASLRDVLIHEYFGIDAEVVNDIIQHKLSGLEAAVQRLLIPPAP